MSWSPKQSGVKATELSRRGLCAIASRCVYVARIVLLLSRKAQMAEAEGRAGQGLGRQVASVLCK